VYSRDTGRGNSREGGGRHLPAVERPAPRAELLLRARVRGRRGVARVERHLVEHEAGREAPLEPPGQRHPVPRHQRVLRARPRHVSRSRGARHAARARAAAEGAREGGREGRKEGGREGREEGAGGGGGGGGREREREGGGTSSSIWAAQPSQRGALASARSFFPRSSPRASFVRSASTVSVPFSTCEPRSGAGVTRLLGGGGRGGAGPEGDSSGGGPWGGRGGCCPREGSAPRPRGTRVRRRRAP